MRYNYTAPLCKVTLRYTGPTLHALITDFMRYTGPMLHALATDFSCVFWMSLTTRKLNVTRVWLLESGAYIL